MKFNIVLSGRADDIDNRVRDALLMHTEVATAEAYFSGIDAHTRTRAHEKSLAFLEIPYGDSNIEERLNPDAIGH